jgi:hypothetical protein
MVQSERSRKGTNMNESEIISLANERFPGNRFDMAYQVVGIPEAWIVTSSGTDGSTAVATDGVSCNLLRVVERN